MSPGGGGGLDKVPACTRPVGTAVLAAGSRLLLHCAPVGWDRHRGIRTNLRRDRVVGEVVPPLTRSRRCVAVDCSTEVVGGVHENIRGAWQQRVERHCDAVTGDDCAAGRCTAAAAAGCDQQEQGKHGNNATKI